MKFLIWITCLFINASIMTLSKEGNVALGAIPNSDLKASKAAIDIVTIEG